MSNKLKKALTATFDTLLALLFGAAFGGMLSWLFDNCLILAIVILLGAFASVWYHFYKQN